MRQILAHGAYSFNPAAQQITFNNLSAINLEYLYIIVDITNNNTTIYQGNSAGLGGTVSGNVITLAYNTTTGGFQNTDILQIAYEGYSIPENHAIENGGNLAAIAQALTGTATSDNPQFVAITGDPNGDFAGVNILEQVIIDSTGLAINTRTLNPVATDINNATKTSDAPAPINISLPVVGNYTIIDTQGYNSIIIQSSTLVATISTGNDLAIPFVGVLGATTAGVQASTINSSGTYIYPCSGRYLKIAATTGGIAVAYLRTSPFNTGFFINTPANIVQLGSSAVVTGGLAGTLGVGSAAANGVTPTTNPVIAGGVYQQLLGTAGNYTVKSYTSTILTDSSGALWLNSADTTGTTHRVLSNLTGAAVVDNAPSTPAMGNVNEVLVQIRDLLKVIAHYEYENPFIIANALNGIPNQPRSSADEPDSLLNDFTNPSIITNNLN